MVDGLKINDLGPSSLSQISSFSILVSNLDTSCKLYLVYFAKYFAAGTQVTCASIIFEDDPKTSPNNGCMDVSAEI